MSSNDPAVALLCLTLLFGCVVCLMMSAVYLVLAWHEESRRKPPRKPPSSPLPPAPSD